jgi:hypothetical protein
MERCQVCIAFLLYTLWKHRPNSLQTVRILFLNAQDSIRGGPNSLECEAALGSPLEHKYRYR